MFDTDTISRFQQIETPFYYYDLGLLRQTLEACKTASDKYGFHVHYAMKANFNPKVLEAVQSYGFGADCVSGNEVTTAIANGFDKSKVVFAGVGKSDKEINIALDADIFCFNVESVQELNIINDLAKAKNKTARVAIRINPNVDAHTHHFITTGLDENKFGINSWQLNDVAETLRSCKNLQFVGIHFHIGSQITDMEVYRSLCIRINEMQQWFEDRGFQVKVLNTGGGLGVDYHNPDTNNIPDFESYFKVFKDFLHIKPGQEVHFELGRALVAQSAALVSRVLYVKMGQKKNFLILDAGMTELIRPMLYQAYQKIENLSRKSEDRSQKSESESQISNLKCQILKYDVVGPICESTDCFQKDVELPESFRGDIFAIRTAGAYGEVMASRYNLRDAIQSVYSE
ncbi:diaminopimelate decarboxylase [Mucilaginibacter ginsenosidivorans]|uniref:Diaminopimelate decarboxylase n=1 Tax=Mucilaginibacter ginsenosidivorans TaxID=398053 RepID=A0A5B8V1B8_9SPHI|nr:diaminopimelate decarboxylase [Mucilaginibacter ginsenosidivorans]QEC64613.1 diaminopimelate decarboxylase [Mucilaginibacter ginsenosidivorans]